VNRLPPLVRQHIAALRAVLVFTVLCGIIYPVVLFGVAQAAFHSRANGSTVSVNGKVVGSSLLCQEFTDAKGNPLPQYFQPRASNASSSTAPGPGTSKYGCDPGNSAASNLGPNNPALLKLIQQRRAQVAQFNGVSPASVPPDAVTASGSGLDPDISPQYAYLQVNRVAKARHLSPSAVHALVAGNVQGRNIGFLGEPGVNVLALNAALDKLPAR
jgi:K+-transporting ATPase ATPase C chain